MTTRMRVLSTLTVLAMATAPEAPSAHGTGPPSAAAAVDGAALIATSYRVEPDVIYLSTGSWDGKLDLYLPRRPSGAMPTAILFHGGGWVTGTKDEIALDVLPYLAMGFAVVNVDYRVARVATAPAAVEDSRCALRWVIRHAPQYGFDPARLVLVGSSAGAHLALMAAMAPASAGFDGLCPGNEPLTVAAVVNFFGIVDVAELIAPAHPRDFAVGWVGPAPDAAARAARVSPINYVSKAAPAVLTLHGEADPVVPYSQARRLHEALDRARVPNRLVPIRGGGHGDFDGYEVLRATRVVREFLLKRGLISKELPFAKPGNGPQAPGLRPPEKGLGPRASGLGPHEIR
jgi:acetyl esterase/lipase